MEKFQGSLCIISAPSGAGKSTLIKSLYKNKDNLFLYNTKLSISYTTRTKREGEIHGKDYFFISIKEFKNMINQNIFFEYAKIFDHYYGTKKNQIKTMLNSGTHVILNIDWQGAKQIRDNKISSNIYTIFILPPSKQILEQRLRIRGKDTEKIIISRMKTAINEIHHFTEYDYIIINDNFQTALTHLQSIILSEQLRLVYQKQRYNKLINNLLHPNS